MAVVRVVVDVALDREFDYSVPVSLAPDIRVGMRVVVPLGRRITEGYVVEVIESSPVPNLKPVKSLVRHGPDLSPALVALARWMADYYCAPFDRAVRTLLPGAIRKKGAKHREVLVVRIVDDRGGPPASAAEAHEKADALDTAREAARPPVERTLSAKQQAVLDVVRGGDGMRLSELTGRLGISAAPVRTLEKKGLVSIDREASRRDPFAGREVLPTMPLELMEEQREALKAVKRLLDGRTPDVGGRTSKKQDSDLRSPTSDLRRAQHALLLYGVTGSGKTEVYLQAISHVLEQGKGAVVLVPEIALTPQTVGRFRARFGEKIAVLHSHLSEGERHDEWHRIQKGEARIVVGARSAVFAPVEPLGLIVVDEEHEPSYKQEEMPRYHARDIAVMRGHLEGIPVVLGSATPSLESWMNVRRGKYQLATLPHRADHRSFPRVRVVDMRLKRPEDKKKYHVLSHDLMEAMRDRIDKGEQTILFLNRRGFSSSLICKKCGHVAECSSCSVSLTYHRHDEHLHCHICGARRAVPGKCPGCGDPEFKYSGVGTQRVEHVVKACFPKARVQRMDTDVTRRKDSYDRILGDFRVGKIDILIGTQMIAKGLHFPNVTLVGVVYADLSLHIPDFRAGERTFQLLAQVAGRAGRGDVAGEVIVQTYTPFQPAVQAARRVDFEGFSDQELEFRKELSYPPFSHLVCIGLSGSHEERTAFSAQTLAHRLKSLLPDTVVFGDAAPAPLAKAKKRYRYQIMLRSGSVKAMTGPIREALAGMDFPGDVRVSVDVDAVSLL